MAGAYLDARDFVRLPASGRVDPLTIRFSQRSIAPSFKAPYRAVADLTENLRAGRIESTEIEPIRLVVKDGKVFTLGNRRLKAFQDAGIAIPYTKLPEIPASQGFKFTMENEGTAILVRDA